MNIWLTCCLCVALMLVRINAKRFTADDMRRIFNKIPPSFSHLREGDAEPQNAVIEVRNDINPESDRFSNSTNRSDNPQKAEGMVKTQRKIQVKSKKPAAKRAGKPNEKRRTAVAMPAPSRRRSSSRQTASRRSKSRPTALRKSQRIPPATRRSHSITSSTSRPQRRSQITSRSQSRSSGSSRPQSRSSDSSRPLPRSSDPSRPQSSSSGKSRSLSRSSGPSRPQTRSSNPPRSQSGSSNPSRSHSRSSDAARSQSRSSDAARSQSRSSDASRSHSRTSDASRSHSRSSDASRSHSRSSDTSRSHSRSTDASRSHSKSPDPSKSHSRSSNPSMSQSKSSGPQPGSPGRVRSQPAVVSKPSAPVVIERQPKINGIIVNVNRFKTSTIPPMSSDRIKKKQKCNFNIPVPPLPTKSISQVEFYQNYLRPALAAYLQSSRVCQSHTLTEHIFSLLRYRQQMFNI